jgi:hypothetical protein
MIQVILPALIHNPQHLPALFIQHLREQRTTTVPAKWQRYPPHNPQYREGETLIGFPEEDKKYLRVYYEVLDRWPREPFEFQELQIEVLAQIRDQLSGRRPPPRGAFNTARFAIGCFV